jgi:hypothetical protein
VVGTVLKICELKAYYKTFIESYFFVINIFTLNLVFMKHRKMSFLFHFGDLLLDGKDPVDDSVDKIVINFLFFTQLCRSSSKNIFKGF